MVEIKHEPLADDDNQETTIVSEVDLTQTESECGDDGVKGAQAQTIEDFEESKCTQRQLTHDFSVDDITCWRERTFW